MLANRADDCPTDRANYGTGHSRQPVQWMRASSKSGFAGEVAGSAEECSTHDGYANPLPTLPTWSDSNIVGYTRRRVETRPPRIFGGSSPGCHHVHLPPNNAVSYYGLS